MATQKARKGGGPRGAAGKKVASRNALRHGFSAVIYRHSPAPERLERIAQAIIGDDCDPAIVSQALRIAENEIMLSEIATHKVWVVKRLRERYAVPFAAKDNSLQLGTARFMQGWLANREIKARLPAIVEKYGTRASSPIELKELETDDIVPVRLKALLEEPESPASGVPAAEVVPDKSGECDEYEALEAAVRALQRLDRYEQRAWSRQKRAVLQLANIKLNRRLA